MWRWCWVIGALLVVPASAQQVQGDGPQVFGEFRGLKYVDLGRIPNVCGGTENGPCMTLITPHASFHPRPRQFRWEPAADITAYELALSAPLFQANPHLDAGALVDHLPPEARRHWREIER